MVYELRRAIQFSLLLYVFAVVTLVFRDYPWKGAYPFDNICATNLPATARGYLGIAMLCLLSFSRALFNICTDHSHKISYAQLIACCLTGIAQAIKVIFVHD